VRSAVNDLQALGQGKKKLVYEDVSWIGYRDRQDSVFNVFAYNLLWKTISGAKQAMNMSDVDNDMLFDGFMRTCLRTLSDPHDLVRAMDALSMADVYKGQDSRVLRIGV